MADKKSMMPAASSRMAPERLGWTPPRLVRLGTVEVLTGKKDKVGRNDGGSGNMRRT